MIAGRVLGMIPSLSLLADVIQIDKTAEYFRLLYDVKGRFTIHRITSEEAKVRKMHTTLRPVTACYLCFMCRLCQVKVKLCSEL